MGDAYEQEPITERKMFGRNPEGKVEIVTTMGKLLGSLAVMVTLFTLITGAVISAATDKLRLELQNTFLTKQEGITKIEYELRHRETERAIERLEKRIEAGTLTDENIRIRLDRIELELATARRATK